MNVKGCGPGWLIARAVVVTLVGCPVGWSAIVADPASRSGVWEATETIDGATVHFRLNVTIRTNAQRPDGTFELRDMSGWLFSTGSSGASRPNEPFLAGFDLVCAFYGKEAELKDEQLSGSCQENTRWNRIAGVFGWKGETVSLLLVGPWGDVNILFRRIPIDTRSLVDGDWQGTSDLVPRRSLLHFRTNFERQHVLTLDNWDPREGSWGLLLHRGFSADDQTISFTNGQSISHSAFQGTLSPDKQRFTGHYSGGQFAADSFVRLKR